MTKKHIEWSEVTQIAQKLPDDKQETLYQELKRSGQVDIPEKYTETHLEGGEENLE